MAQSWPAGRYVLVVDDYETPTGQTFRWGDVLDLDAEIAQLMGEAGAIAPEGSPEAERARKPSQVLAAEALELRARALEAEARRLREQAAALRGRGKR
jgi:hypothetical protein